MPRKIIALPDLGTIELQKRSGSRSIRLSITDDGVVRVTMPSWVPYQTGLVFVRSKRAWIDKHRTQAQSVVLKHGQAIGKAHHLYFQPQPGNVRTTSRLKTTEVIITHSQTVPATDPTVQRAARAGAIRALRNEAEALLPSRLQQLALQGGFAYKSVQVKQLKRRWGSCNEQQEITLNLFLMQLPWTLIDYVLWHELAHTKHLDHGPDFWATLTTHVPHAKALRKAIRQHKTTPM